MKETPPLVPVGTRRKVVIKRGDLEPRIEPSSEAQVSPFDVAIDPRTPVANQDP